MSLTRFEVIVLLGLSAFALRVVPQLFFVSAAFPEKWDRLLRYLSYALLCGIISTTLFMTKNTFDLPHAPMRAAGLLVTVLVARWAKSAVTGMLIGVLVVSLLSWLS